MCDPPDLLPNPSQPILPIVSIKEAIRRGAVINAGTLPSLTTAIFGSVSCRLTCQTLHRRLPRGLVDLAISVARTLAQVTGYGSGSGEPLAACHVVCISCGAIVRSPVRPAAATSERINVG